MADQTCMQCRHSLIPTEEEKKKGQNLACRRFPPQTHFIVVLRPKSALQPGAIEPREEQRSAFPMVLPGWKCGEWAPSIALSS